VTAAGLLERNPAAHGVWIVAEAMFALLVVFVLIDLCDRLRDRLRARPEAEADAAACGPVPRRRLATPFGVLRRFWAEGRTNRPAGDAGAEPRTR
jgi:hypothetical protein